jgi:DNA polymerase-1
VIATLAKVGGERGMDVLICSSDKDCRQLITDRVAVYDIRKDRVYDREALAADWGIAPEQVVDFQALVGDKIDNVPGVPLIGPKVAKELLDQYGTLENVLDHADDVAGAKRKQNLKEHREAALLSRKLVELDRRTPVAIDWQAARVGGADQERVTELFRDFGFRSLTDRALAVIQQSAPIDKVDRPAPAAVSEWSADYTVVDTPEELAVLVSQLGPQSRISFDTETTDIEPRRAEIVGYALGWKPGQAFYIPVRGPEGDRALDPVATANALRPILKNSAIAKIGQNLKYDIIALRSAGIELRGVAFDTMIADFLLDSGERTHNLDHLARKYLAHETIKIDEVIGTGKNQLRMDQAPVAAVGRYAAEDADVPLRLLPILEGRLSGDGLAELNADVEVPLIDVLADLEYLGVRVDVDRLAELRTEYGGRLAKLREEIEELAGHPLNIDSPKQLASLLFSELGLPVI